MAPPSPRAGRRSSRDDALWPAVGGTGDLPSPLEPREPRAQLTFLKSRLGEPGYRPNLEQVGPVLSWPNRIKSWSRGLALRLAALLG